MGEHPQRPKIRVLFDGWSLAHSPNSTEALHLLLLLEQRHPEVHASIALPREPPPWLPASVETLTRPAGDAPGTRLSWEQSVLPKLFRQAKADLLHLTGAHPPVMGNTR